MSERIEITVNGRQVGTDVPANMMLIDLLRDRLGLTGTKLACDQAVCGACTVLVDGLPVASCSTFAFAVDGADVKTIEGLGGVDGSLDPVQQAFAEGSAFQCGYCTPGMIMLVTALLDRDPKPNRTVIKNWLGANICRCTGYKMIFEAVEHAAALRAGR